MSSGVNELTLKKKIKQTFPWPPLEWAPELLSLCDFTKQKFFCKETQSHCEESEEIFKGLENNQNEQTEPLLLRTPVSSGACSTAEEDHSAAHCAEVNKTSLETS